MKSSIYSRTLLFGLFFFSSISFGAVHGQSSERTIARVSARCVQAVRSLVSFSTGQESLVHFPFEKGIFRKALRGAHEILSYSEWLISPIPRKFIRGPTSFVFTKQWKNPSYEPSREEWALLKKYHGEVAFKLKKEFMLGWPRWTQLHKALSWTRRVALSFSLLLLLNHGFQVGLAPVSAEAYFADPKYSLTSTQVQIINELVPFPHTAIRIGDKVYSYGFTHLTSSPVSEYLSSERDWFRELKKRGEVESPQGIDRAWAGVVSRLRDLPRSVQIITLNLSEQQRAGLKRDLEMSTAKRYCNITFVNDCTTMMARTLKAHTGVSIWPILDASPSQSALLLSAEKTLGSPSIGPIYFVMIDDRHRPKNHSFRNLGIMAIESKVMVELLPFNLPHRLWVELTKSPDKLQVRDREVEDELRSWKRDVANEIRSDPQIAIFYRAVEDPSDPKEVAEVLKFYFEPRIEAAESFQRNSDSDFKDIVLSGYRVTELRKIYDELRSSLRIEGAREK